MVLTVPIVNPKIVAERSEMLRACMLYDNHNHICLSDETIQFLCDLCQDDNETFDLETIKGYVFSFIVALDSFPRNQEKNIGAMMNSYIGSTLANYFCCNDKVMSSCIPYLAKDSSQFFVRQLLLDELAENNIYQLLKQIDNLRIRAMKNKNHLTQQKRRHIPGWENKTGPVLKPGESLIL